MLGRKNKGSTLIISLVGIFLVGSASVYFASAYEQTRKLRSKVNFLNLISQIQANIKNGVDSSPAWLTTTADPGNNGMACLPGQTCPAAAAVQFVLWPPGVPSYGNKALAIYDGTNPTAGFDLEGRPCSTFSMAGNILCPIHVNLTWSTCGPAPCTPAVTVQADIIYRPGPESPTGAINDSNYTLGFTQVSTGTAVVCSTTPPPAEVALCAAPPYPADTLYCLPSGWKCGQIYY